MAEPKKDFKKDKPKAKPTSPWGLILVILFVASALGKLGFGGEGNNATSTATTTQDVTSSEPPPDKPPVIIGQ